MIFLFSLFYFFSFLPFDDFSTLSWHFIYTGKTHA
ncbi:hypothetical protein YPC_1618 [Yersinia pestis biovar Medievalis str. Harbin 35]|nr:hypothetical protein YPC_1618 [Yersinia pestis biovar Medievalis str. Harbin 35]EEO76145.1 hypothetical protein YP516_2342 [Yersinia pestis Nepal516]EEO80219.1 hypothetical protein YPF_3035 [Yersinia pestis biovar Orientalis str. India 195]EEO84453.1 hypothetical protein YPH_0266 [Yersinia pestis biovar Orientalis str. PEXU2]EEO89750.1 hypothetical protein YPS_3024 [Yersinia pestis Pestoides A]